MSPRRTLKHFHSAPIEVVENIMKLSLYSSNETSPFLQDDDLTGHWVDFRSWQRTFCRTFLLVSKPLYRTAMKLLWHCIFLTTPEDLHAIRDITIHGPVIGERLELGTFCRRIEVRICGGYEDTFLSDLIQHTPNLEVLILRTSGDIHRPTHDRPGTVIRALSNFAPNVKRLQFESTRGDPSLHQIKTLLLSLPSLTTLHVDRIAPSWNAEDVPSLATPATAFTNAVHWQRSGLLLGLFKTSSILPSLRSLYIQRTPSSIRLFLSVFGEQLHELWAYPVGNKTVTPGHDRPRHIIQYCPQLRRLVCFASEGPHWMETFRPIPSHKTLAEIDMIFALRIGAAKRAQGWIVLGGMQAILGCQFPKLSRSSLRTVPAVLPAHHHVLHTSCLGRLADEIVDKILEGCLYGANAFSSNLDYSLLSNTRSRVRERHADFASKTMLVCWRFYRVGKALLWKFIPIRSHSALRIVHNQALEALHGVRLGHIGEHTLRLEVRIATDYDAELVADLLQALPRLKIFILCNDEPLYRSNSRSPDALLVALRVCCPSLERIELISPLESPTSSQVQHLLYGKEHIRTLRIAGVSPPYPSQATVTTLQQPARCLTSLAFDCSHWCYPRLDYSHLNSLGMMIAAAMRAICERYGPQLREVLFVAPADDTMSASEQHILDLCPNVLRAIWVLDLSIRPEGPTFVLPPTHQKLETLTVLYGERGAIVEKDCNNVLHAVHYIRKSAFPGLRRLEFRRRIHETNAPWIANERWFHEVQEEFAQMGVEVTANRDG
ncbi:hypothetical protein NMY22_g4486 [Coprinellus aureogranulatus]|nr:hypothetical protein NMY22_g4486 [Coprinellus aureogranulatus]